MLSTKHFQRAALPFAAASVILAGLLSACGNADPAKPEASAAPAPAVSTSATAAAGAPQNQAPAKTQDWLKIYSGTAPTGTNAVQLRLADNNAAGQYVTADDRALYRFDKDTAKPPTSTCVGDCAAKWPPLIAQRGQAVYAAGVDPQLVGFIERADGACQVTIAGWPVYFFAKDTKPGDLLGQGVGGVWHAVTATGGKAGAN
ncbi:hypothetical protein [Nocardia suismassiliense]|uniref:hypothetical protein n=1 Tax=Nocardia suismassiliense TaxID=2077092 RepID=UPI000D1F22AC|nr:hypothetical protein [Nocardia suismassiliense]